MARFTLGKNERLKSRKWIKQLFSSGDHTFHYPLKFVYMAVECENPTIPIKITVTVSKRRFKSAVKRNLIKRRIKEAYRLIKPQLFESIQASQQCYVGMFIYVGNDIESYDTISSGMTKVTQKWLKQISVANSK